MKKITENALLFRVNQLKEKMAMYEAAGDGSQTPTSGLPPQTPNRQTPGNPGYNVKPAPALTAAQQQAQQLAAQQAAQVAQQQAAKVAAEQAAQPAQGQPAKPEGIWDRVKGAAEHLYHNPAQVIGGVAADAMNGIDHLAQGYNASRDQPAAGTHGQPKVGAKQGSAAPAAGGTAHHQAPDPKVLELQKKLIAQGYPLKADGIMGPKTQAALDWQAQSDKRDAGLTAINNMDPSKPAPAGTPPAVSPTTAPSTTAANITPAFASQTPAAQASAMPPPEKPEGVQVFKESPNHVSFGQDDSLARIVQLVNW